ncbi:glutathione S-transferase family protein [Ferrovibrio sp.]|uniref:glutathione S-transferase family protein n=1 Tax=Ferrovibrio sp. TaxID=1917215 RepID=UPI003512DDAB
MLTIWGRASSVNVQKVLWAADELGLTYDRIDCGGPFGGLDGPEYLALNPNGVIPAIRDSDGTEVWESNAIVRYLAARHGNGTLWPADPAQRSEADRWMDWVQTTLGPPMRTLFWGFVRDPAGAQPAAMDKAAAEASRLWARLEAWLARDGRDFVIGDRLGMGDIPLGCHVQRWLSFDQFPGFPARPALPRLQAWHDRLTARPGYRRWVMVPMT